MTKNIINKKIKLSNIALVTFWVIFFGLILPAVVYFFLSQIFISGVLWQREALHSFVEAVGGSLAFFLVVIILLYPKKKKSPYDYIISTGILGMALLDLFHSTIGVGNNFVYLHSMAIFIGGILFSFIFIPSRIANKFKAHWLVFVVCVVSIIGILSFLKPELTPIVVEDGIFNYRSRSLNYVGGILMILSSFRLIIIYFQEKENKKYLLLAVFCLLFGSSGVLFEASEVWDMRWWYWHLLRFSTYIAVFFYIFIVFRDLSRNLLLNINNLDKAQKELKRNLKKTEKKEQELKEQNRELQKLNKVMTGREVRMVELKNRIKELEEIK